MRGEEKGGDDIIWRTPNHLSFSSTSNDATCLPAIIFDPLAVVEPRTVDDVPPLPSTRTTHNLPSCDCRSWTPIIIS
jgi:hypothetical protein